MKNIFSSGILGDLIKEPEKIDIRQFCEEYYKFRELSRDERLSKDGWWIRFRIYLQIKELL